MNPLLSKPPFNNGAFQALAEAMPQLVWAMHDDGRVVYANQQWLDYTGQRHEENHDSGWDAPFYPDDRQQVRDAWRNAIANNTCFSLECRIRRADGIYRWWLVRGAATPVADGDSPQWLVSCSDIDDLKQAALAISANASRFREIFDASPIPMALNDEQQNITFVNPAFIQAFGYTLKDIPTLKDWWPKAYPDPDYRHWVIDRWQTTLEQAKRDGGEFPPIELVIHCKDDTIKTVSACAAPLEKSFAGIHLVVLYDITERKKIEQALRYSEASLKYSLEQTQLLLDSALDAIVSMDDTGIIIGWNNQAERIFATPREKAVGRQLDELIVPEMYREAHRKGMLRFIETGISNFIGRRNEVLGLRADGSEFPMELTIAALKQHGSYFFSAYIRDISERKMVENELRIAATAFESQEAMLITDANQVILKVNQAFTRITGYSAAEAIGNTPALLKSERQDRQFYQTMWESLNLKKFWQGEIWNRRKNGELYSEWLSISAVTGENGQITHYVAAFADTTPLKKAEDTIHNLAFYDPLTNLANRRLLKDRLSYVLNVTVPHAKYGAVLFIDLDNFKGLNDIKGHETGDLLLIEVTQRLRRCLSADTTIARLGGDDFVVMLEDLGEDNDQAALQAESIAEDIRAAINQPFDLRGYEYKTTSSIGISLFRHQEVSVDELLKHSDAAMYQAKQSGRNTIRFFDPDTHAAMEARIALEADLALALPGQQFQLYYQVQVDHVGRMVAAEVLVRWQHPELGLVMPAQFIPLAEERGLIVSIGQWVLETACVQIKIWEQTPIFQHLQIAVNVSPLQFRQSDFVEQIIAVLQKTAINPDRLKLELTESLVLEDVSDTISKMRAIKQLGVHFSMDDFGTGYSSLAYLTQLPLDQLKIDQSFVRNIGVKPSDAVIVQTIIGMASNLGMDVIAEGVETEAQRAFLERNGCKHYQGYLFGKPLPLEGFEQMLRNKLDG